jgi:hypothetical protein
MNNRVLRQNAQVCILARGVRFDWYKGDAYTTAHATCEASGVPKGIRTPVTAVKGRCPGPLDDGDRPEKNSRETTVGALRES